MLAALIIVFREVFEAGLIVGIVLAVTSAVPYRLRWIAGGLFAGLFGACVVASFAGALTQLFEGMGQELFNAAILSTAVIMLTWHNVWMARHGREMAHELRTVGQAVAEGAKPMVALAMVIAIAVLREGSEVALFLYGVAASGDGTGGALLGGGVLGMLLGVAVCLATYLGLMRIPPRALFRTTTVLITLLAAGMAAQAVFFLARANWLTSFDQVVWDSSAVLPEAGLAGRTLKALIGYTDQPTGMQLAVYVGVILATVALMRLTAMPQSSRAVAAE
ncbi:FTR1 family protein [Bradyrhizobium ontarionense]|uniref:FTR1 family protein n=1 Tax=Bradyrhizobium ontarionense TaxID=2898149 RepID=A0ABY3R3Z6_9BRAD|nr:FTR1 family protein [Bradyrhizobium sp. A19]UFZ02001.1 FTR1 family protein [Bradyrhizobium sp. A19]